MQHIHSLSFDMTLFIHIKSPNAHSISMLYTLSQQHLNYYSSKCAAECIDCRKCGVIHRMCTILWNGAQSDLSFMLL